MTTNLYRTRVFTAPGGDATSETLEATIPFDGSQGMGDAAPGRAHRLADRHVMLDRRGGPPP